jgi:hypothetical protein
MNDTEKLNYLIEAIKIISNSINNESPDMALWEVNRVMQTIEQWESE